MTLLPVIVRELRAQARQKNTYWVRVLGAAALLTMSFVSGTEYAVGTREGEKLFSQLHGTLFLGIWILVPLMTADCLSREKREGTLGLLFLTPLKAHDIVLAKGMVHGLRALGLLLAALPLLTVPILTGGVGWFEAALAATINLSALFLALAAGMLASAWNRSAWGAQLTACLLATLFLALFAFGYLLRWTSSSVPTLIGAFGSWAWYDVLQVHGIRFLNALLADEGGAWGLLLGRAAGTAQWKWLEVSGEMLLFSFLAFALIVVLASLKVKRSWQDQPLSLHQLRLLQTFCAPRFWRSLFRSGMRRRMERNPIVWLQQYSVRARLVKWGWCLAVVLALTLWVSESWEASLNGAVLLVLAGLGLSAAGSFQRERETGALELLLVTPLRVSQIIWGRVGGIWRQFLPALMVLGIFLICWPWATARHFWIANGDEFHPGPLRLLPGACLALPLLGLYFSMQRMRLLSAWLLTCLLGVVVPVVLGRLLNEATDWNSMVAESAPIRCGLLGLAFLAAGLIGFRFLPEKAGRATRSLCLDLAGLMAVWLIFVAAVEVSASFGIALLAQLVVGITAWRRLHVTLEQRRFAFAKL